MQRVSDDFIVEVAAPDVDHLRAFVLEHVTSQPSVADARTTIVYDHLRRTVVEPMADRA